ncbi:two-component system response regulator CreB [Algibacillus agarilyticus]|uniref:two-component system response regulator CreB n=1 Tax=Algibacillus agarilyticus TaxID=2234133 RepID=UPI000DD0EB7B|nr:two-component system response regulator CreB [Algibacillus agarilyticus]
MPNQTHILLVEDEASIADNVKYALKQAGIKVTWTHLGQAAIEYAKQNTYDMVVLDVGLPDINGFEVCKNIRLFSDVPILFLTARSDEIDRVVGLEIGGDDYVTKPFSPRELSARVNVITRRYRAAQAQPTSANTLTHTTTDKVDKPHVHEVKTVGLFTLAEHKKQIHFCATLLDLTAYEFGILALLIQQPERVFSREQLMSAIWSAPEHSIDRAVDNHIKTLRAKLRVINADIQPLTTHRGMGYSLQLTEPK